MNRPEVQNKPASTPALPRSTRTNSQRGIMRIIRANKRAEAEARQQRSRRATP